MWNMMQPLSQNAIRFLWYAIAMVWVMLIYWPIPGAYDSISNDQMSTMKNYRPKKNISQKDKNGQRKNNATETRWPR